MNHNFAWTTVFPPKKWPLFPYYIRVDSSTACALLIKQQSEKVSHQWAWQMTLGIEKSGAGRQNEGFPSLCSHQGAYVPEIDGFFCKQWFTLRLPWWPWKNRLVKPRTSEVNGWNSSKKQGIWWDLLKPWKRLIFLTKFFEQCSQIYIILWLEGVKKPLIVATP